MERTQSESTWETSISRYHFSLLYHVSVYIWYLHTCLHSSIVFLLSACSLKATQDVTGRCVVKSALDWCNLTGTKIKLSAGVGSVTRPPVE